MDNLLENLRKEEKSLLVKELESFAQRLRHESLFFTRSHIVEECIKKYACKLGGEITKEISLYRARKHEGKGPPRCLYQEVDIRNPPNHKAREGRLNAAGISFLYMANSCEIAVLETQCRTADFVTSACFNPKKTMSYFSLQQVSDNNFRDIMSKDELYFFDRLDRMIGEPVDLNSNPISYRVTQWFGEFIRSLKYDCIVYSSSTRTINAYNICGFYPDDWEIKEDSIRGVLVTQEGLPEIEAWDL